MILPEALTADGHSDDRRFLLLLSLLWNDDALVLLLVLLLQMATFRRGLYRTELRRDWGLITHGIQRCHISILATYQSGFTPAYQIPLIALGGTYATEFLDLAEHRLRYILREALLAREESGLALVDAPRNRVTGIHAHA